MKKKWDAKEERYFGIGIYKPKTEENVGTLWRTAYVYGASFIFVIDAKYKKQSSDVFKVWSKIPLFQYKTIEAFLDTVPYSCKIVGIEMDEDAIPIKEYEHPQRGVYLLGSENNGLTKELIDKCQDLIVMPGEESLNVAVAGSVVIFDRINKLSD
ncbi:RNA methyltransferase [Saprospiraceae bacterium]|nr:RNA methyltransferase [Saprospiraceae bacterium]